MTYKKEMMTSRINMMSIVALLTFLLTTSVTVIGQTYPSNVNLIPNVAPPTPDVAKLGQFGQYPVNYFTGLVNIDIPLYEIKAGDLSVPISLRYHTAGIKVTEKAGWVGLGWSLEPGGTVSRTVMGLADEVYGGYLNSTTIRNPINTYYLTDLMYLDDVVRGRKDTEPDIYSYSFGSYSGKFVFNQADNYSTVYIPYSPVRIIKTNSLNNLDFEAYDPYGVNYKFDEVYETSTGVNDAIGVRSAWKISEIISKNRIDKVEFSYASSSGYTYQDKVDRITVDDLVDNPVGSPTYFSSNTGVTTLSYPFVYSTEQKVTEITFPLGKVTFHHGQRDDGWTDTTYGTQKRLDSISVYNYNITDESYELMKCIRFVYSYFTSTDGSQTKRLKLDELRIQDKNHVTIKEYSFDYNTSVILPKHKSWGRDYWGYYNGLNSSTSLVPRMTIPWQQGVTTGQTTITIGSNYTTARDPNPSYMQACILEKITYPTGGYSEFDYETNKYLDGQTSTYTGGLRISQIRNYVGTGATPVKKTFKYGENESGYGRANFILNNYFIQNEVTVKGVNVYSCYDAHKRRRTFLSSPIISIEPYDGSPVVYPEVTVYEGDATTNIGKTVFNFSDYTDSYGSTFQIGLPAVESNHYKRGRLTSEEAINADGSSTVHLKENTYGGFSDSLKSIIGLKAIKTQITDGDSFLGLNDACDEGDIYSYQYAYYRIKTGDTKLLTSTETNYSTTTPVQTISTSTSYEYGNYLHQQITKTTTKDSEGRDIEKEIDYPHESTGQVYTDMVDLHMIAFPVKETNKIDGNTAVTITKTYYNRPETNVFEPTTIQRKFEDGDNYLEVDYQQYDDWGNVEQFEQLGGMQTSVIWGYNNSLPIAIVKNSEAEVIYYTGFEDDPYISDWSGTSEFDNSIAKTGDYSLKSMNIDAVEDLNYSEIFHPTITAAQKFKYSVWAYSTGPSAELFLFWDTNTTSAYTYCQGCVVSESSNTLNEWVLIEGEITVPAGVRKMFTRVDNNSQGNVWFDDLKFYPADAKMTTYSYDPLVGITSQTDPNNQTAIYEYDDFGRLMQIKDTDGNSVQETEYNYVNQ